VYVSRQLRLSDIQRTMQLTEGLALRRRIRVPRTSVLNERAGALHASVMAALVVAALSVACGSQPPRSTERDAATRGTAGASTVPFQPSASVALDDRGAAVASTVTIQTHMPDASFPRLFAIDIPREWDISGWKAAPNGEAIGTLVSDLQVGAANGPCNVPVHAEFRLLSAAPDGVTVSTLETARPPFPDVYVDGDSNGLPDGVDRLPSFLASFPMPGNPFARAYGQSNVSAFPVFIDLVTRDLGADGYRTYVLLNDPNFHSPVVTSMCGPIETTITLFGTSAGPSRGLALLRNAGIGDHAWGVRLAPPLDADGDGIDNGLDNCALTANPDQRDGDSDGLGDTCDPSPDQNRGAGDEDGDGYANAADDCPLLSDPTNIDRDFDLIGDACDANPLGEYFGPETVLTQSISVTPPTADATTITTAVPELASLPPVFDPLGTRGRDEPPNPSSGSVNPDNAPKQDVASAHALGRDDCDASWFAVRSQQGGWSICFPPGWEYASDRRGATPGFWEDSFTLRREDPGSSSSSTSAAITVRLYAERHRCDGLPLERRRSGSRG
jgi:thrombospondin type 3 repeat protein